MVKKMKKDGEDEASVPDAVDDERLSSLPFAAASLSNQNPISRYEQSPTPSQPMNIRRKFAPSTRFNMKKVNMLR